MADSFTFELVSPERLLVSAEAVSVVIPGSEGEMTILADHAPAMTTLRPGLVTVTLKGGETQHFVVFGGFADILPNGCTLLAEAAFEQGVVSADVFERHINEAQAAREAAAGDEETANLEEYLSQLTTLRDALARTDAVSHT